MFLINYIENGGGINILISINTFLNHYIDLFEFRAALFFVAIFTIINLNFINFMFKLIVTYDSPFLNILYKPFEFTYL